MLGVMLSVYEKVRPHIEFAPRMSAYVAPSNSLWSYILIKELIFFVVGLVCLKIRVGQRIPRSIEDQYT